MQLMGKRIKELRIHLGLTQKELGTKIGVAQNTITQYERGLSKISIDILIKLTIALDSSADYLLGLKNWY